MTSASSPQPGMVLRYFWVVSIPLLCLVGALLIVDDYGVTWDEGVQSRYGELVLDYFRSGFTDKRCNEYYNLRFYGPLFESVCALLYGSAGTPFLIRHFCIGLTAIATVLAVIIIGRNTAIPGLSVYSALALIMLPRFVGHAFNNSKDIPFACAFTWAILAILTLTADRTYRWWRTIWVGVSIGLAMAMRIGGILLIGYTAIAMISVVLLQGHAQSRQQWRHDIIPALLKLAALVVIAWSVMVLPWPWAHDNVIANPLRALHESTAFSSSQTMRFAGKSISSHTVPRHYLWQYFAITTPIPLLLLAIVGTATAARAVATRRDPQHTMFCGIILLWLLFPLTYFTVFRPPVYDGIRHFLFVLPAMALLIGLGATTIVNRFHEMRAQYGVGAIVTLVLMLPTYDIATLHPYQSSYFNRLAGGVRQAAVNYEVDYWASSYREAALWINERAAEHPERTIRVLVAGNHHAVLCAAVYFRNNIHAVELNQTRIPGELPPIADYYIGLRRFGFDDNFPNAPLVHTIARQGATFSVIKGRATTTQNEGN